MRWIKLLRFLGPALCCASLLFGPVVASFAEKADSWRQVVGPRDWHFPQDDGSHPEFRTEWWYFTGNLHDGKGNTYGYELTFFREGVKRSRPTHDRDVWSLRDIYLAHFTITDVSRRRFLTDDRASRTGPGLAGSWTDGLHVWLRDWSATQEKGVSLGLKARSEAAELGLNLVSLKPRVIQGKTGISKKGEGPGQASYYVSYTDLDTRGWLRVPGQSSKVEVRGVSWFDHEFGSNQLTRDQAGWDWFGLHLSDGRELMLYLLRRTDGSVEPASSGTIVDPTGAHRHLALSEINIAVLDHWRSAKSGAYYPSRWRIAIPTEGIELDVRPVLSDQELLTPETTGVTYWEGAVEGQGRAKYRDVACTGYVELTGYAGNLGGLF